MASMEKYDVMITLQERLYGRPTDESRTADDQDSHCGIFEGSNQTYLYGRLSMALLR